MMSTHTPGPWGIASRSYEKGDTQIATFPEGKPIARCKRLPGNSWANAYLVMAAPELLEACKAIAYLFTAQIDNGKLVYAEERKQPWFAAMQAAIAKAEGRG